MKVAVISHSMVEPENRARWRALADRHPDTVVTLVVPAVWPSLWSTAREPRTYVTQSEERGNYRIIALPAMRAGNPGRFVFVSPDMGLRHSRPDILCINQEPVTPVFLQTLLCRRLFARRARTVFISSDSVLRSWRRARLWWMRTIVNREVDLALAVNHQVKGVLQRQGFDRPITIQTAIGADEAVWSPGDGTQMRRKLGLEGFVVGYVGRLTAAKGVMDLLAAFERLELPKSFLIVGEGGLRPNLLTAVRKLGLEDSVKLVGYRPRSEVPDYMSAMDVLVLPSRYTPSWREQFGLVLIEAMLCGVLVIGSNVGGIPNTIGDAGILFPSGDVATLATHLRKLQVNEYLRSELAARGRERALRKFSASALADETYDLFRQVVAKAE